MQIRTAIITVTRNGTMCGEELSKHFADADLLVPEKFLSETSRSKNIREYRLQLSTIMGHLFDSYDQMIFILSLDEVIRLLGPYLRDKKTDPTVVVMDEQGKFAISVFSGSLKDSRDLVNQICDATGAQAVITTADDSTDSFSIDSLGESFGWIIENLDHQASINTAIDNGEPVGIIQDSGEQNLWQSDELLPEHIQLLASWEEAETKQVRNVLYISHWKEQKKFFRVKSIVYRPKVIVLGLSCEAGTEADEIESFIRTVIDELGFSFQSIKAICSIESEKMEFGLLEVAEKFHWETCFYSHAELKQVSVSKFSQADFEKTETYAVTEAACLLYSNRCQVVLPKKKIGNCTVSISLLNFAEPV